MKFFSYIFLALLFVIGSVFQSWARVDIQPRLSVREEYNDNLFLDAENEESDFITTAFPGIRFVWDSNYLNLDLDYGLKFKFYNKNSDLEETDPSDTQRAALIGQLFPGRDFTLSVSDTITRVTVDERDPVVEENEFVNKSNLNRFLVNPQYRFRRIKNFTATLDYRWEKLVYDAPEGDDSDTHGGSLSLSQNLLADKLTLTESLSASVYNAKEAEDYKRQEASLGVVYRISRQLTLNARAGLARIDFDENEDSNVKTGLLGFDYSVSPRLTTGASYSEDFSVSVDEGTFRAQAATAYLSYQERVTAALTASANRGRYSNSDREDRSAGVAFNLTVPLRERLTVGFDADGRYFEFLPENEEVYRYSGGFSLGYQFRILSLGLGYTYRVNDSNFEVNDYENGIAYLTGNFEF